MTRLLADWSKSDSGAPWLMNSSDATGTPIIDHANHLPKAGGELRCHRGETVCTSAALCICFVPHGIPGTSPVAVTKESTSCPQVSRLLADANIRTSWQNTSVRAAGRSMAYSLFVCCCSLRPACTFTNTRHPPGRHHGVGAEPTAMISQFKRRRC